MSKIPLNTVGAPYGLSQARMRKYTERIENEVNSLSPDQSGALELAVTVEGLINDSEITKEYEEFL